MYYGEICNRIKLVCFFKFIVYKINSKMVVLTERKKTDITDTDELNITTGARMIKRKRET
jgi:hypothetical protein